MQRKTFLTLASMLALAVGTFALLFPAVLLESKGLTSAVAGIWVSEVGILLIATGVAAFMMRTHEDSPTLRAVFVGNLIVQVGLAPIELMAYARGVIPNPFGIVPNTIVHVLLALGFLYYLCQMKKS
jgi:hypothetical protein